MKTIISLISGSVLALALTPRPAPAQSDVPAAAFVEVLERFRQSVSEKTRPTSFCVMPPSRATIQGSPSADSVLFKMLEDAGHDIGPACCSLSRGPEVTVWLLPPRYYPPEPGRVAYTIVGDSMVAHPLRDGERAIVIEILPTWSGLSNTIPYLVGCAEQGCRVVARLLSDGADRITGCPVLKD